MLGGNFMTFAEELRSKMAVKAVKNVKRGENEELESGATMYRDGIKLDLQRSRLMTESFKQTEGEPMIMRRAKALSNILDNLKFMI